MKKQISVHNAVWMAFMGPIPPGKTVDHIAKYGDMTKERSDNRLCNLRLASSELQRENQRPVKSRRDARRVEVWKIGSNDVEIFDSSSKAAKALNLHAVSVRRVAKGEQDQTQGYRVKFVNGDFELIHQDEEFRVVYGRHVSQYGRMMDPRTKAFAITPIPTEGNDYAAAEDAETGQKILFHHLIAQAFPELVEGQPGHDKTLDHKDRNVNNNKASNLAWKTKSEQALNREYRDKSRLNPLNYKIQVCLPSGKNVLCDSIDDACRFVCSHGVNVNASNVAKGIKSSGIYKTRSRWKFSKVVGRSSSSTDTQTFNVENTTSDSDSD